MVWSGMVKGMDVIGGKKDVSVYCEECERSGHTRSPIPKETLTQSQCVLGCIFSYICEVQTITHEGFQYFITFVNNFSQFITVYPIKKKSDALDIFKDFLVESKRQTDKKLKVFHTDGGGEYFSNDFIQYLSNHGIVHEKTNPDTPQENGIVEQVNRTMISMTIAMLESVKSSIRCTAWPYALCHAALIKNIIPHSALPPDMSLFELWTGNKPSVSTICTFGCNATLAIPKKQRDKLGNRSISGLHLGLALGKKAFLVYDPNTCRIHKSCDVHFFEGSPNSECVTIEIPDVESQSHVVEGDGESGADNDVEGNVGGNGEGEVTHVDEGGKDEVSSGPMPMELHRSGCECQNRTRDDVN